LQCFCGGYLLVTDINDYDALIDELKINSGSTSYEFRKKMAAKAFALTAAYDANISSWFAQQNGISFPEKISFTAELKQELRYGENPHQKAAFYHFSNHNGGIACANQIQGKELSYNNISDADAALALVNEFNEPAAAIIKHANPCGVALADSLFRAYEKALDSDPVSAFGGIFAFNHEIDASLAKSLSQIFVEVILAPSISNEAKAILATKKNIRILLTSKNLTHHDQLTVKSVVGGFFGSGE